MSKLSMTVNLQLKINIINSWSIAQSLMMYTYLWNSSFLLPFWFIRRHFNQNFGWVTVNLSISSSLKPAPGMSPAVRSTSWSSAVLVILNLPQGPFKSHFHATSGFLFWNRSITEFLWFGGFQAFSLKKALLQEPNMNGEQSSLRLNFLI